MDDIGKKIKIASNMLSQKFDIFAKKYNLTATQISIIDFICSQDKATINQNDIEQSFMIKRSTTTVILQKLERKGFIVRKKSTLDRRNIQVTLTRKSLSLEGKIRGYMSTFQNDILSKFNEEDINKLLQILDYIIKKE